MPKVTKKQLTSPGSHKSLQRLILVTGLLVTLLFAQNSLFSSSSMESARLMASYMAKSIRLQRAAVPPPPDVSPPPYFNFDCAAFLRSEGPAGPQTTSTITKIGPNGETIAFEAEEWSIHRWQRDYCRALTNAAFPKNDPTTKADSSSKQVLFIDAREECERYREFLITVRQSNHLGPIVLLVYYPEDRDRCARLEEDFAPLEVFYASVPRWEWTMFIHHGIVSYFKKNPKVIDQYTTAVAVRPDRISWCSNAFEDIPTPSDSRNMTLFAVWGDDTRYISVRPRHRSKAYRKVFQDNIIGGTPFALLALSSMLQQVAMESVRIDAEPSWSYVNSNLALSNYSEQYFRPFEPVADYKDGNCYTADSCPAGARGVRHHTTFCYTERRAEKHTANKTYVHAESFTFEEGEPMYSPFCYKEYRYPVSELPKHLSLKAVADKKVVAGAEKIRRAPEVGDAINSVFTNPSADEIDLGWGVTDECPHGKMAVLTMMGGYPLSTVEGYISSFLYYANPKCVKLVMLLKDKATGLHDTVDTPFTTNTTNSSASATTATPLPSHRRNQVNIHQVADLFPDRIEAAYFGDNHTYAPTILKGRSITDLRFEVMQLWLEMHYKEYRYILATDSKDYVFASDPLDRFTRLLSDSGNLHSEFVGSVVESMAIGSFSGVHNDAISMFAAGWMSPCGPSCFPHLAKKNCTNGEPLGIINSGHVVASSVGMLHYTRCHLRLTVETQYKFDSVDQGLLTFYLQGLIQDAGYPHKVLLFSSSRSGFTNPTHLNRVARRRIRRIRNEPKQTEEDRQPENQSNSASDWEWEYTMMDCEMNIISGIHQSNRAKAIDPHLRNNSFLKGILENRMTNLLLEQHANT